MAAMDYLVLRHKLKQELRSKLGCTQSSAVVTNDNFGKFFGSSETVFSGRVMHEIKSLLEKPPVDQTAHKKTGGGSRESEKRERIQKIKESRDYSCLFSEEPISGVKDVPVDVPKVEVGSVPMVKKNQDKPMKVAKEPSYMTSSLSKEEIEKIRKSRDYSFLDEECQTKKQNVSRTAKGLIEKEELTKKENVSGIAKGFIKKEGLTKKQNVSGNAKQFIKNEGLTKKEDVSGTMKQFIKKEGLMKKEDVSGTDKQVIKKDGLMKNKSTVSGTAKAFNKKEGLTKEAVRKENTSRIQEGLIKKEGLTNTTVKSVSYGISRREGSENRDMKKIQGEQKRTRDPVKEKSQLKTGKAKPKSLKRKAYEIEEEEEEDPIAIIRSIMGYDPTKYRDAKDDMMVASFADVEREERRSAKLARLEDKKELQAGAYTALI